MSIGPTKEDFDRLSAALHSLGEHYDTVQIFISNHEEGATMSLGEGVGNWFARFGQIKVWIVQNEAVEADAIFGDSFREDESDEDEDRGF
jgi:hypothetical protein